LPDKHKPKRAIEDSEKASRSPGTIMLSTTARGRFPKMPKFDKHRGFVELVEAEEL